MFCNLLFIFFHYCEISDTTIFLNYFLKYVIFNNTKVETRKQLPLQSFYEILYVSAVSYCSSWRLFFILINLIKHPSSFKIFTFPSKTVDLCTKSYIIIMYEIIHKFKKGVDLCTI